MELDIAVEAPWPDAEWPASNWPDSNWPDSNWQGLAERAVAAAAAVAPELADPRLVASLLFTSDAEIHALNREWRGRNGATNVLSFPMLARRDLLALTPAGASATPPIFLGDIALASETCAREAAEKGIALETHAAHLIIHGLLHLAGHDHETSTADAEAMEALETEALALMGIADPYGERTED